MEFVSSKDGEKKKKGKKTDSEEDEEGSEEEEEEEEVCHQKKELFEVIGAYIFCLHTQGEDESDDNKKKRGSAGKKPAAKKAKKGSDDSEASEPSEEGDSEEEYSPKKSKPIKTRKLPPKKKKGSESDSDEDWAKSKNKAGGAAKKGGVSFSYKFVTISIIFECVFDLIKAGKGGGKGYTRTMTLSPELAALVGQEEMARHEVVKKIWSIIKERDLYDPKNKQYAICDDALFKVIGVKRFRTFGMMKYLKNHFIS